MTDDRYLKNCIDQKLVCKKIPKFSYRLSAIFVDWRFDYVSSIQLSGETAEISLQFAQHLVKIMTSNSLNKHLHIRYTNFHQSSLIAEITLSQITQTSKKTNITFRFRFQWNINTRTVMTEKSELTEANEAYLLNFHEHFTNFTLTEIQS